MELKYERVGALKEGNFIYVDGEVYRILKIEKSKPGKHGAAKARMTCENYFTGAKKTFIKGTGDDIAVPIMEKRTTQVISVNEDSITLMDLETYEYYEVQKEDNVEIEAGKVAVIHKADNRIKIIQVRDE